MKFATRLKRQTPVFVSHNRMVRSREPDANKWNPFILEPSDLMDESPLAAVCLSSNRIWLVSIWTRWTPHAMHWTTCSWSFRTNLHSLLEVVHTRTVLSLEHDAIMDPSWFGLTTRTHSVWPRNVSTQNPVETSHILMVLSRLADNKWSPDGMNDTLDTLWSWPESVFKQANSTKSHSLICKSAEQDARSLPLESKARSWTWLVWPLSVLSYSPVS